MTDRRTFLRGTSALLAHASFPQVLATFLHADGACMVSSPTQNPSLTYMALTARAAAYAVEQLQRREL